MRKVLISFIICLAFPAFAQDAGTAPVEPVEVAAPEAAPAPVVLAPIPAPAVVEPTPVPAPTLVPAAEPVVEPVAAPPVVEPVVEPAPEAAVEAPATTLPAEIPVTPGEPKEVDEAAKLLIQTVEAFKGGNILLGISLMVLLLVFLTRKFFKFIPAKAAPWVALTLGILAAMASSIAAGESWYGGLITGAVAGLAATGLYEAKKSTKVMEADPAPAPPTATPPA